LRQYYYTVATLPHLHHDSGAPFKSTELIEFFRSRLAPEDFVLIENCSLVREKTQGPFSPVLHRWYSWEKNLRNELLLLRSKNKKSDGEKYRQPVDAYEAEARKAAFTAFSHEDPFAAEEILHMARWSFLDECEVGHHFDIEKLIVYLLKLLLLERRASFDVERGKERLGRILSRFEESFTSKSGNLWKK
jgi:hypothetical protein